MVATEPNSGLRAIDDTAELREEIAMQHTHGHSTTASPSTALPTGKLGLWWFLASEIITFGGLIASYIALRLAHPAWAEAAQHLSVVMATVNTVVLLTSSLTMVLAFAAVDGKDDRAIRFWLACTVLLGLMFLSIKGFEWSAKLGGWHRPGREWLLVILLCHDRPACTAQPGWCLCQCSVAGCGPLRPSMVHCTPH